MTTESSVIYNLQCDVRNLEINVSLEHLGAAFGNLPSFADFVGSFQQQNGPLRESHAERPTTSFKHTKIKWQEKIPNPFHIHLFYLSRNDPISSSVQIPESLNVHESHTAEYSGENRDEIGQSAQVVNEESIPQQSSDAQQQSSMHLISVLQPIRRIFTYIDSETPNFDKKNLLYKENTESGIFRPRRIAPISNLALKKPIVDRLSDETSRKQRSVITNVQRMLIMAYCGPMDKFISEYDPRDEYVLCRIESLNNRIIKFSSDLGTFRLETRYGIYKVTLGVRPAMQFNRISDLGPRLSLTTEQEEETTVFELPDGQNIWLNFLIIIEEGINFPHDGLYVEYTFEIPPNMEILQKNSIFGRTQICFTQEQGMNDVAKFSFPLEITLAYNNSVYSHREIVTWARMMLRVCAENSWGKHYIDGYATISLPTQPGKHFLQVDTWRPINPYSNLAMLREKFLGQAVDLKLFEYCGSKDSNDQWNKIFSKVGLTTESSGTITLTVNCIQQSKQFISSEMLRTLKYGSLLHKIGMSGNLHWRIMKVLMEFEEAKKQLLKLRSRPLPTMQKF